MAATTWTTTLQSTPSGARSAAYKTVASVGTDGGDISNADLVAGLNSNSNAAIKSFLATDFTGKNGSDVAEAFAALGGILAISGVGTATILWKVSSNLAALTVVPSATGTYALRISLASTISA